MQRTERIQNRYWKSKMTRYGILGQCLWFAFGNWWGLAISARVMMLFTDVLSSSGEPMLFGRMALFFVPHSLLISICFAIWIAFRSRLNGTIYSLRARVPALLGLACPVAGVCMAALLGRILLVEASLATGASGLTLFFVFPVVAAEIAFRIGRRSAALAARSAERSTVDAAQNTSPTGRSN